jgi:hypothetical protein
LLYLVTQVRTYGQIDHPRKRYCELLTIHVEPVVGSVRMTEPRPAAAQAVVAKVLDIRSPRKAVDVYRVLSEMLAEACRRREVPERGSSTASPPGYSVVAPTRRVGRATGLG